MLHKSWMAAAGLLLGSCEQQPPSPPSALQPSAPEIVRLPDADPSPFYSPAACGPSDAYVAPPIDAIFNYQLVESDNRPNPALIQSERIRSADAHVVTYEEEMRTPGLPATGQTEVRQTIAGVLPGESQVRKVRYPALDPANLLTMQAGEVVKVPASETSTFQEQTRTVEGQYEVTFVGCGRTTALVTGAPNEPVRIYKLVRFARSAGLNQDTVRYSEVERLVSSRFGWMVLERAPGAMMMLTSSTGLK